MQLTEASTAVNSEAKVNSSHGLPWREQLQENGECISDFFPTIAAFIQPGRK